MTEVQQVLQKCTVEGTVVKLPEQLGRKLYLDVAKSLELIGGKWKGGKIMGFVFQQDPTELLAEIANGVKRNLKKEFQTFFTPYEVAKDLVREARIEKTLPRQRILEPSAGQGHIVKAIFELYPFTRQVDCCELLDLNRMILEKIDGVNILANDFLSLEYFNNYYDVIIANPPFSKNQDIDHIYKMWDCLKPGGRIVTIASKHWIYSNNKKEAKFRDWIYETVEASVNGIDAGAFSESGTNIETVMIIIDKL